MATPVDETLGAYQRLIEQGKIRWCGASNLSVKLLEAALAASKAKRLPRYEVLQPEYNLADRHEFENGLADLCQREQIGVITYFSLAKGFLTGKYRSEADLSKSSARRRGQGLSQSPRISHRRRARGGRRKPQGETGGSRAGMGYGEAWRHRADRERHLGRTDREPCARNRAYADGSRHGRPQRGERAIAHTAAGRTLPPPMGEGLGVRVRQRRMRIALMEPSSDGLRPSPSPEGRREGRPRSRVGLRPSGLPLPAAQADQPALADPAGCSRNSRRRILPILVFGSASRNSTWRGVL